MDVYFSCSIRNNTTTTTTTTLSIGDFIKVMEDLELNVLTKHMASNPDLGKSDNEIYMYDIELIKKADFVVIETSIPSLGVGYVAAMANQFKKPVLSIRHRDSTKLSAMINGDDNIIKFSWFDAESLKKCINTFKNSVKNRVHYNIMNIFEHNIFEHNIILFLGAPGSGKSTICKMIEQNNPNIVYVSTGEILRNMIENKEVIAQINYDYIKKIMETGDLIPADIMKKILDEKLQKILHSSDVILDGYPSSIADIRCFTNTYEPKALFWFEVNQETSISRQISRNQRQTDTMEKARKRYNIFNQSLNLKICKDFFEYTQPNIIDASKSIRNVYDIVQSKINTIRSSDLLTSSFWLQKPKQQKSTRFHFHIDRMGWSQIKDYIMKIHILCGETDDIDIKNYPIYSLELSKQTISDDIYTHMINFHKIPEEKMEYDPEAFCTGRLGDDFNPEIYEKVLNVISNAECKLMTEVEEYLGEWSLQQNESITGVEYDDKHYDIPSMFPLYEKFRLKSNKYELHHGINLIKSDIENFKSLFDNFCEFLKQPEFNIGGIFIFFDKDIWKIRTNEFSDNTHEKNKENIIIQAKLIQNFFKENNLNVIVNFSIEIVHAIYQF